MTTFYELFGLQISGLRVDHDQSRLAVGLVQRLASTSRSLDCQDEVFQWKGKLLRAHLGVGTVLHARVYRLPGAVFTVRPSLTSRVSNSVSTSRQ